MIAGRWRAVARVACFGVAVLGAPRTSAQSPARIQAAVETAYRRYLEVDSGRDVPGLPLLAQVETPFFGIAVVTRDGRVYAAGNVTAAVPMQAIASVFTAGLVMEERSPEALHEAMVPRAGAGLASAMDPLLLPGSLVTTSLLDAGDPERAWSAMHALSDGAAGGSLREMPDVYRAQLEVSGPLAALSARLAAQGALRMSAAGAADLYARQCALGANGRNLAIMAATLAFGGRNPLTHRQAMRSGDASRVLELMKKSGLAAESEAWFAATGLAAKSGDGAGFIAVAPGRYGIAVVSGKMGDDGIPARGRLAIAEIARALADSTR